MKLKNDEKLLRLEAEKIYPQKVWEWHKGKYINSVLYKANYESNE